jgi:hypothetical protein
MSKQLLSPLAAGFILAGLGSMATAPEAAAATCHQWDVSGHWEITQSNPGVVDVRFDLVQEGERITGTGYYCERCGQWSGGPFAATYEGTVVEGTVTGTSLKLIIDWKLERLGEYTALIGPEGDLHRGRTRDLKHPESTADWSANRPAVCKSFRPPAGGQAVSGVAAKQAQVRPVKRLGKRKVGATATVDATLYSAPGLDAPVAGTLARGTEALVLGQQDTWYRLDVATVGGAPAWAQGAELSFRFLTP